MNDFSIITLELIIDRCLAKYFGQNDVIKSLVSNNTYNETWNALIKWMKYELDLGRAVKLPNLGVISIQNYKDDSIIYFKFDESFLTDCGLIYEEVSGPLKQIDLKEVRFPTIGLNFVNIKKFTAIERDIMIQAIQNILIEVENIFQTFDNFQIDLGVLGKFLVEDKNLRFLPYIRNKKKVVQSKITIKNMIDLNLKRFPQSMAGKSMENGSQLSNQAEPVNSSEIKKQLTVKDQEIIEMSQKSMARSIFSQNEPAFVSPLRRGTKPIEEDMLMNEMFGAGTDPKALNQNFSKLAEDANYLMQASFTKPPYARIRCPPVIDYFCRTLSAPVASQYNSLSASSRIGLFYSNATKYLYFDQDTKGIAYLKVKENRTKLTANEELLQAMATQEEEIKYIINKVIHKELLPKIEAKENCYSRYQQYIQSEIPREIIAPIRQYWITSILDLIPANYKDLEQNTMERIIDGVLNEINEDYYFTIKKSILDYVLKEDSEKLRIGILQRFDEPLEYGEALPRGVIIDEDWVGRLKVNEGELKTNLVSYNKATLSIINSWANIGKESYFVLQKHDSQKESLTDFVLRQKKQIGKILKTLKENWIPSVSEIYKNELGDMSKKEIFKFFVSTKILMSSQLRDLIYKSLEEFKAFFLKFHKEQYLEAPQCIENDLDRSKYLQKSFLVIKLKEEDKKVRLSEKIETVRNEIVKLIDEVVMTSHNIPLPQNNFTRSNQKALFSISPKTDEVVVEIREIVDTILYENLGIIDKVTEVFGPYEYLLNEAESLSEKLKKKLELREYQELINKYRDISEEIDSQVPNDIYMNLAMIDCREIKETLCKKCEEYAKKILEVVDKNLNNLKQKIGDDQKSMFDIFHHMKSNNTDAQHYEECEKQRELIERTERLKCMNSFKEAVSWLMFLYQNKGLINSDYVTSVYATAESVHKIDDRLKDVRDKNNSMKDSIKNDLDRKKLDFDSKLKSLITEISDLKTYGGFFDFGTKEEKVRILEETVSERKAEADKINFIQEKIGSRRMNFEELNNAEKNLLPYRDLWVLANKWDKTEYEKVVIFSLVPDEVIKDTRKKNGEVAGIITTFEEMEDRPKEPLDAAQKLKDLIVKFLEVTPLLQALCAKGMQDRHWVDVSKLSEMEWNSNASWTLKDCIDNGMIAHKTKLLEIADRANKEYSNFSLLEEMASEWITVELSVKLWKETQTYALIGDSVDDLRTLLDDHIIKTQTMKGSQFARVFEERIKNWEDSLLYIRNTLEVWVKVQANWIYLQPIFNSPDIRKELMAESELFNRIDKKWRDVMAHILANNKAIKIAEDPSLLDTLTDMLTKLEGIQNELSGYLNTKRTKFPRFYFLSADSLIEVLSDAKDPKKIQKFAKILFEGVQTFTFDPSDVVLGVKSSEGEVVVFQEVIDTKPHAGLVEIWLQMFEDLMVQEVRLFIENSFKQFDELSREEFVMNRPAMAVLNVDMTEWTRGCEKAIMSGKQGLPEFFKKLDRELLRIVKLVRTDISRLNRATLEALIVLDVHNKDVVKGLIEAEVTSIYDFDYEAQLRYYWEVNDDPNNLEGKRDTSVKIINNVLQYNYEYLGNSSRLVITPLTDRCYRTLCGAIGSNYGGAPEGPAGTGKTETVKDLAKALARMIIVFNCTGGLTYQDMGRFFKGLSCTGGWSCLDEFNRINLEVLSVISQQLQCIQNAIKLNKTEFDFMDSRIKLKNTCNCFITMNPGYAGRSDLPDNLKALFRSVAMMVPDYSMIGQIRLYSFGFADAESLSKKIVTTYKLSSEQISAQKHYDYGMRAVNSVLVAAGNLKKKSPNEAEDVQILKAINEVNQAKFLDVDLPLFNAITKDLFPETILPALDLSKLLECVDEVIIKRNLQGLPYFIEKVVQLYQMILVRHGLMVVGVPYGGKTTCVDVLADALALLQEKYKEEKPVEIITINPKAVSYKQLYGFSDIATGEWTDGVLPTKFKKLANPEDDSPDMRRWLLFDGPVDALWIEDMNTVLDDNKKLCLTNGDVFFMSNDMNLVFETMDLLVASPATVSRCGMIFFEADVLGWMHLYESWKKTLPKAIDSFDHAEMDIYFTNIMTPIIKMLQKGQLEQTAPTSVHNIITTLLGIAYKFLKEFEDPAMAQGMEFKERRSYFDKVFTYATIWSLGATMTNDFRLKFDAAFKKFINVADPKLDPELQKKHRKIELPEGGSGRVFDFLLVKYVEETEQEKRIGLRWVRWSDFVASDPEFPSNMLPNEITIQTVDTVRYSHLINMYIEEQKNVLVCGPTGTGKTIYVKKLLRGLDKKQYQTLEVGFSAQTTASQVQTIIDTPLFRRPGKNTWGPPTGKKLVVFVDDFNMPKKEKEGAQPPIELMRQLIDKKGWYDNNEKSKPFKHIHDLIFVAAMGQPGPSSNLITPRVQRLMSLISFTIIDDVQMETIFKHILNWKFTQANKFEDVVAKVSPQLVKATLQIYSSVIGFFKPLPSKSHYLFNLRDFAKVINGLCLADKDKIKTKEMVVKLWIHEVWRVFGDRLNSEQDRLHLMNEFLKKVTHKVLGENFDNLLADLSSGKQGKIESLNEMRGLVFTDVLHPAAMKNRPYELVSEPEKLLKACSNALKQYDLMSDKPLNIVLFNFAIEHLLIISRILKQPGSNALLIGIGGSGRQSLTRLASKMGEFGVFQIELSNTYGVEEWKDDLKSTLKAAGGKNETTVFIFRDNQIKMESFIEDVNNLLNNGEVPNLFLPEEQGEIFEFARKNAKEQERDDVETSEQLMSFFIETCKKKLHVVLNFSPIGDNFRNKIRMFPSLVNCCTIDWFFEWPQDALVSVAESFIGQTELSSQIKAKCVDMVQYFHTNTKEKAAEFLLNLKRYYYVTPTSFIEMIGQFKSLLEEKNESVLRQQKKYENGYKMIIEAESSVSIMQANLNDLVPKLEESSKRVAIIVEETNIAKEKAEVVKIVVTKEELIASEKAAKAKVISDECTADMALVIPEIEKSLDALNNLDPKQFEILRTANVLPDALEEASKCLAIITKQNQEKKMNTTTMKQETDWTKTRKKMYMDVRGLLNMMKTFNGLELGKEIDISKEINILDEKTFKLIETEFETCADLLNIGKIRNASDAVGEIFLWIEGQRKLYPTELAARPKRAKFLAAKAEYDEAMSTLAIKQRELREKEQEVDALVRNLEMNNKIKMDLEANYKKCKIQLERAELLITNLADEKGRWKDLAEQLKVEYDNLVGDVLISAGMISYLGPFTSGYRSVISKDWSQLSLKMNIPGSKEFSFVKTMGEPVKIRAWQINGLPADDFSTENAIILNKSRRWSLCIDPQLQANKWIKSSEKERKLIITNPTINFMQDIERAIRQGLPCLLENVTTEIEPALDPILLKQIVRSGGSGTIKLGDKIVDYDDRFFLFITTKLRNPHYLPEVSTKLTIINFMITFEGLSDQLLGTVVSMEMPKQEAEKNRLIAEGAQNKKELMELENEILQILSLPKDKLLEDEDAINVLTKSKKKSETIKEKQKISEVTEQEINEARKNYIEISKTTSCLFFAITDLNAIDPMYQYSLTYFMQLFRSSIDNSDKPSDITERLSAIETHFLYNLYVNISRSLFVKDKLLLSFLLCVRTQIYKGEITEEAYSFFLTGATGAVQNKINQPKKITWMKESMWLDICKLSEFEGVFSNIHKNFEMNLDDWSRIYESNDPLAESFPPSYAARLTNFDRMLLIRVLRPDKIVPFIQKYVIDNLGQKFIEIPPFSLEAVYKDSTEQTPLIFVLTPGVDPYNSLLQFANQREIKLEGVSLGQGQGPTAERLIKDASENGYWVVLQNCHLAQSFMNPLEKKCEELLLSNKIDPKFRLWLTSYPSTDFPTSVLQNGIKMTNEPPSGLRNNLKAAIYNTEVVSFFNDSTQPQIYHRLLFGLCFFHAVIQERKKYGPLGWNIPYEFTESDLRISTFQLRLFIDKYPAKVPLEALKYLTAECNYGGKVTDDKDRRLMGVLLQDYYNPSVYGSPKFEMCSEYPEYYIPEAKSHEEWVNYVEELPLNAYPLVYGFHRNASITKELNETNILIETLLACQEGGGASKSDNSDSIIIFIDGLLQDFPQKFNEGEAATKYAPRLDESMNIILLQELARYNKLISVIRSSLSNFKDALNGVILFSFDLEEALNFIKIGKVPKMWMDQSYPSLKPLGGYLKNLIERIKFYRTWIENGIPSLFWLSGFFFPQGFLTGILQNYARKYTIAIDKLKFGFEVNSRLTAKVKEEKFDTSVKPEDGAYLNGFYLEGARFSYDEMSLAESHSKILFVEGPVMYFKPMLLDDKQAGNFYDCPLYRTGDRRGVLLTTGHSTNFVMMVKIPSTYDQSHWIKRGVAAITQLND